MNKPEVTGRKRFLMCGPSFYSVDYVINPWMKGNVGKVDRAKAENQWNRLHEIIASRAEVELIEPADGLPDMVFTANAGLVMGGDVVLAHFAHSERSPEEPFFKKWFEKKGFSVHTVPDNLFFEGAGDALFDSDGRKLWVAYGDRTSLEIHPWLAALFNVEVVSLRLTDKRFYHLDTCFFPLPGGYLLYYPDAFDSRSVQQIERFVPEPKRIAIDSADASAFSANGVALGRTVITRACSEELRAKLSSAGFESVVTDLSEFMKAGGSAKCLTLRLDEPVPAKSSARSEVSSRKIVAEGQLLDAGRMSGICDAIVMGGGSFRVRRLRIGQSRQAPSTAEIEVTAPDVTILDSLIEKIVRLGARLPAGETTNAKLERVVKDGVAPDSFYSSTIYKTEVRINGGWAEVSGQRMDSVIVVANGEAHCELLRNIKAGDMVVTGSDGIRLVRETARAEHGEGFGFMQSGISSERRVELSIGRIAWEMNHIKNIGGKIIVLAGPVVAHTGGSGHLAWMARNGYMQGFLGGNAIAVHDIETALLGTSLGVDLKTGKQLEGGHRNHMKVINTIRKAGSIKTAVEQGILTSGLFYELTKMEIPYSLAGSIRDDGPLPETEMDMIKAQADYAQIIKGADMILMLSSMLHSIGTGNMTPAGVRLVCVDINPAVVTKLADRGSLESTGIVTDVGLFLTLLTDKLKRME